MNPKSLANLSPIKKGERLALKPESERATLILSGRVKPDNQELALDLINKTGSKSKAVNYLLENYNEESDANR